MMKLTYRRAILSVCEDLTNPHGQPMPIGVLLIGDLTGNGTQDGLDGSRWAGAVVVQPAFVDPFMAEHINDALSIVKERISLLVEEQADVPAEDILHGLYSMLRNTLSVTSIGGEQSVEVHAASEELYGSAVIDVATRELTTELDHITKSLDQQIQEWRKRAAAPRQKSALVAKQVEVWAVV